MRSPPASNADVTSPRSPALHGDNLVTKCRSGAGYGGTGAAVRTSRRSTIAGEPQPGRRCCSPFITSSGRRSTSHRTNRELRRHRGQRGDAPRPMRSSCLPIGKTTRKSRRLTARPACGGAFPPMAVSWVSPMTSTSLRAHTNRPHQQPAPGRGISSTRRVFWMADCLGARARPRLISSSTPPGPRARG